MHEVMQQLLTKAEHEKATVYLQMRREMLLTKTNIRQRECTQVWKWLCMTHRRTQRLIVQGKFPLQRRPWPWLFVSHQQYRHQTAFCHSVCRQEQDEA